MTKYTIMSDVSNIVGDPPKNDRPKVTSIRVKTKPGHDDTDLEIISLVYYTERDFSVYAEALLSITGVTVSFEHQSVAVPHSDFSPLLETEQGFQQIITPETQLQLEALNGGDTDVVLEINYNSEANNVLMSFE